MTWKKARKNLWFQKDGLPVQSYTGQMISFPYLAVGRGYYNAKDKKSPTIWYVELVRYSSSENLKKTMTERGAVSYAKSWMKRHPNG